MNFIPFIVLGLIVAALPFLGFPRATEDILITIVGFGIAGWAIVGVWKIKRTQRRNTPDTAE